MIDFVYEVCGHHVRFSRVVSTYSGVLLKDKNGIGRKLCNVT
jgi:hypothetical protein